jgi:hypothetical protein
VASQRDAVTVVLAFALALIVCVRRAIATQEAEPEPEADEEDPADAVRDAVLVSEADSPVGEARSQRATCTHARCALTPLVPRPRFSCCAQAVVFALIVAEARVKLLCRDAAAATSRFGAYVTPVVGDASNA